MCRVASQIFHNSNDLKLCVCVCVCVYECVMCVFVYVCACVQRHVYKASTYAVYRTERLIESLKSAFN